MDKNIAEFYGSLSEDVKEKLKACKSNAEVLKVLADAYITLNPELLKAVSGGAHNCHKDYCPEETPMLTGLFY